MPIETTGGITVITGDSINVYRMLALRGALKLETIGMKMSRGVPASKIIRDEFGLKTKNKVALLAEYETLLRERGFIK